MPLVRTPDEVIRIGATLRAARFSGGRALSVTFRTDPAAVLAVLPPGLEPAAEPVVTAVVSTWSGGCVGPYGEGAVYVAARHGDLEGDYVPAMFVSTDTALLFGREQFGEPKKLGCVQLHVDGDRAGATLYRDGRRLIRLTAALGPDRGPVAAPPPTHAFTVKSRLAAGGDRLEGDAVVHRLTLRAQVRGRRRGSGTVVLDGGPHEPLGELPVREVLGARLTDLDVAVTAERVGAVPADLFLPYAYGQLDDFALLEAGGGR